MRAVVSQLGLTENAEAKWEAYRALVLEQMSNTVLLIDIDHQKKIARAWSAWRDAFLALDA